MGDNVYLSERQKKRLLEESMIRDGSGVQLRGLFFAPKDGVQRNVELIPMKTGLFYNINFIENEHMVIPGNMASKLLEDFPVDFKIYKVDGELWESGKELELKNSLKKEIVEELLKDYNLIKKTTIRDRTEDSASAPAPVESSAKNVRSKYTKLEA